MAAAWGLWWLYRAYVRYLSEEPGITSHREQPPPSLGSLLVPAPHSLQPLQAASPPGLPSGYQLLFQVCRTSVSWMLCLSACSSRKSNMYLMARGSALPRCTVLNKVSNKSSTNFCRVPWVGGRGESMKRRVGEEATGSRRASQMVPGTNPALEICL